MPRGALVSTRNRATLAIEKPDCSRGRQRVLARPSRARPKSAADHSRVYLGGFALPGGCRCLKTGIQRAKNPRGDWLHVAGFLLASQAPLALANEPPRISKSASLGFSGRLGFRENLRRRRDEPFDGERNRTLRSANQKLARRTLPRVQNRSWPARYSL